jgi:hypothetical protein
MKFSKNKPHRAKHKPPDPRKETRFVCTRRAKAPESKKGPARRPVNVRKADAKQPRQKAAGSVFHAFRYHAMAIGHRRAKARKTARKQPRKGYVNRPVVRAMVYSLMPVALARAGARMS